MKSITSLQIGDTVSAQTGNQFFEGKIVAMGKPVKFDTSIVDQPICIRGKQEDREYIEVRWFLFHENNCSMNYQSKKAWIWKKISH